MKELFRWNAIYELGVPEIDDQHKNWLGIMNKMYDSFIKKESQESILEIIKEMREYTDYHFSTEEKYFSEFGYDNSEAHKKIHQNFIDKIHFLESDFKSNPGALTFKVMNVLQQWLMDHIMKADKEYIPLFKNRNSVI